MDGMKSIIVQQGTYLMDPLNFHIFHLQLQAKQTIFLAATGWEHRCYLSSNVGIQALSR